ncbi:uncharacterized protein [Dermacentor andersoni]|uniref:uncharacterized protein isoform X1 n=1 Tax=Dermacentor andersoni TaxID=34620 RepID=UPI002417343E|nr:uncharacterized protein LOC126533249 isoform X1 [Dermacentor andersoni]
MRFTVCRLLPCLLSLVLVTVLAKPESRKVDKSIFPICTGWARRMTSFVFKHATRLTLQLVKILEVTEKLNGDRATIYFNAVDTVCKPGRRIPTRQRCPKIRGREPHTCFGEVKFLGDSFRRVKYGKTNCLRIDASLEIPATSASR